MSIFKKQQGTVASIHLYGTGIAGHDTLIALYDKDGDLVLKPGTNHADMIGTGDKLVPGRSATETIFLAVESIRARGIDRGTVEVHYDFDFGSRFTRFKLESHTPTFGNMKWEVPSPLVITVDAIVTAAERE